MKSISSIFLLFLIASCAGKANLYTPEKFVDALISSINAKDTAQFNALYVNSEDVNLLVKQSRPMSPQAKQQLAANNATMQQAIMDVASSSYNTITNEISGISTFQLSPFEKDKEFDMDVVHSMTMEIETPDHHKKMIRIGRLIYVNKQWKTVAPIEIDEVY